MVIHRRITKNVQYFSVFPNQKFNQAPFVVCFLSVLNLIVFFLWQHSFSTDLILINISWKNFDGYD